MTIFDCFNVSKTALTLFGPDSPQTDWDESYDDENECSEYHTHNEVRQITRPRNRVS